MNLLEKYPFERIELFYLYNKYIIIINGFNFYVLKFLIKFLLFA